MKNDVLLNILATGLKCIYCKRRNFRAVHISRISRMVSYARKYDVSENLNHYRLDRIRYKMRENISTRNGHIWLDARKFSCAKISTFTVLCLDTIMEGTVSQILYLVKFVS